MILDVLVPDSYLEHLSKGELERIIKEQKLDFLIIDVDGVLTPFHSYELDKNVVEVLRDLKIQKYIVSNRVHSQKQYDKEKRFYEEIQEKLNVDVIVGVKKPFDLLPKEYFNGNGAMIGDSAYFDVQFAKRNGLYSILVRPLQPSPPIIRMYYKLESLVLSFAKL